MSIVVCKFGGTSLGSVEKIQRVAKKIETIKAEHDVIVVVSAMAGETNRLMALVDAVEGHASGPELDAVLATGEQVSAALMAMALQKNGVHARSFNGQQLGILTTSQPQQADIQSIQTAVLKTMLAQNMVPVITGFQGVDLSQRITTLGRGGSDTTAVAIAASMQASCRIYTDVPGVYSADPGVITNAQILREVTCHDMLMMASMGAKVLHIKAIDLAKKFEVPLTILSTFTDGDGTRIVYDQEEKSMHKVSGVAIDRGKVWVRITWQSTDPLLMQRFYQAMYEADMDVEHACCDSHEGRQVIRLSMASRDAHRLRMLLDGDGACPAVFAEMVDYHFSEGLSRLSIIGLQVHDQAAMLSHVLRVLSSHQIDVCDVTTSARVLSVLVPTQDIENAATLLHETLYFNDELHESVGQQI